MLTNGSDSDHLGLLCLVLDIFTWHFDGTHSRGARNKKLNRVDEGGKLGNKKLKKNSHLHQLVDIFVGAQMVIVNVKTLWCTRLTFISEQSEYLSITNMLLVNVRYQI